MKNFSRVLRVSIIFSLVFSSIGKASDGAPVWEPFFDHSGTIFGFLGVDITPQPPQLDSLDEKVLQACGDFGSQHTKEDFIRLVERAQREDRLIERLYEDLELKNTDVGRADFQSRFIEMWTKRDGFKHVFCGELSRKGLGGLHYVGRYLQLHQQQKLGLAVDRLEQCQPEIEEGLVYTVPVKYKHDSGRIETDCRTGYGYELNAYRMFLQGTRAYLTSQDRSSDKTKYVCRYTVKSVSGINYWTALVVQERAIRTFFTIKRNQRTKSRFADACNEESRQDDRL